VARSAPAIDSYGAGGFRLSGEWHAGSLLIVGDEPRSWPVSRLAEVSRETLAPVFEAGRAEVEFLLLGTGAANAMPPKALRQGLLAAGLGLEFMDTPSAARLYNVLTSEGRRLAAALIAV
jgi:uncharacterized protein